jgi:WD40 repeat protein
MTTRELPQTLATLALTTILAGGPALAEKPVTLKGHANVVAAVCFAPSGEFLVSGSWDEDVRVWSLRPEGQPQVLTGHTDWVEAVAIAPDGGHVVSASPRDVRTWNLATGSVESIFTAPGVLSISAVALSRDGRWLACGIRDGTVRVWEVGVDEPRWTFATDPAWTRSLAFSADSTRLAAGNWAGNLRVWNLADGMLATSQDAHPGAPIASLAFTPNGDRLATGSYDATIKVWDTGTWTSTQSFKGHKGLVLSLAYSPDAQLLASGERHGPIKVWSAGPEPLLEFVGHPDGRLGFSVIALAFSPDGKRLASASFDQTVKVWSIESP